jgi:hypothetical protein
MKCAAPIKHLRMIDFRASHKMSPYCQREGAVKIHGRWYCLQHSREWEQLWATHDAIVKRIRSL